MILVGRPGMGKTPPLDFAFRPIRKHDAKAVKQFKSDMEQYNNMVEDNKGKKEIALHCQKNRFCEEP